jgi:hypothetical protein
MSAHSTISPLNERVTLMCPDCGQSFDWLKRVPNHGPRPQRCHGCALRRHKRQTQASYERQKQRRKASRGYGDTD